MFQIIREISSDSKPFSVSDKVRNQVRKVDEEDGDERREDRPDDDQREEGGVGQHRENQIPGNRLASEIISRPFRDVVKGPGFLGMKNST